MRWESICLPQSPALTVSRALLPPALAGAGRGAVSCCVVCWRGRQGCAFCRAGTCSEEHCELASKETQIETRGSFQLLQALWVLVLGWGGVSPYTSVAGAAGLGFCLSQLRT